MARADSLAQYLDDKNVGGFWKTMDKMNTCNTRKGIVINARPDNIASQQHFDRNSILVETIEPLC